MPDSMIHRLRRILEASDEINRLLDGRMPDDIRSDPALRSEFEGLLAEISRASLGLGQEMKDAAPEVPWSRIGNIAGDLDREPQPDPETLWMLCRAGALADLRSVAEGYLENLQAGGEP